MKRTARLVSLILALVFVVALFAGCGGEEQQPAQDTPAPAATPAESVAPVILSTDEHEVTEETKYADEVTIGFADVGAVFSPLNANSAGSVSQIAYLMIYNTLISRDKEQIDHYIPELATEWSHNDDFTEWTFKLRDDVVFTNGEKLTSADVKYSWEAFMAHPGTTGASKLNVVTDVEIINDYEFIYHLNATNVDFEDNIANHGSIVMCKKAVEANEETGVLVGSGVWKFDDFKANTYLTLVNNENTWEEPAISKRFTFKAVAEATAKAIMFENGELDYISDVQSQDIEKYKNDPAFELDSWSAMGTNYVAFNMNSPIAGDLNFRKACAYAIDRDACNAISTQGVGSTWDSMGYWGRGTAYKKDLPVWERDLDKAKECLAQSSYVPGTPVLLLTTSSGIHASNGQVIQQQLGEAGITVEIFGTDSATMMANSNWGSTSYDIMVFGGPWQTLPSSCNFTLQTGMIGNKAQFSNARVDELIELGASTPNGPERQAIYEEIQQITADELPYLGTINQNVFYGRHANCGGAIYFPDGVLDYTYVYKIVEE